MTQTNDPDTGEWNYTYDLTGNLISQSGGGGNLITGDGYFREYNSINQLVRIRNGSSINGPLVEQYYYDPFGDRIKIWKNDSAGAVIYTPFRELMQIRNSSGIYNYSYIYDGSVLVARLNPDSSKYYYHPDHLGSTTLVTDEFGSIVEETFYEPFGDVTSGGASEVKLYTGQFSDSVNCQYYYGARYYNPCNGGFIQPDPIIQNVYNPQALNHYSYVMNNPYKYTDPTGMLNTRLIGLGVSQFGVAGLFGFYGGPAGVVYGIKEAAYAKTSIISGITAEGDDDAYVADIVKAQSGGNLPFGGEYVGSITVTFFNFLELADDSTIDVLPPSATCQEGSSDYCLAKEDNIEVKSNSPEANKIASQSKVNNDAGRSTTFWRERTSSGKKIQRFYNPSTGTKTWRADDKIPEGFQKVEEEDNAK